MYGVNPPFGRMAFHVGAGAVREVHVSQAGEMVPITVWYATHRIADGKKRCWLMCTYASLFEARSRGSSPAHRRCRLRGTCRSPRRRRCRRNRRGAVRLRTSTPLWKWLLLSVLRNSRRPPCSGGSREGGDGPAVARGVRLAVAAAAASTAAGSARILSILVGSSFHRSIFLVIAAPPTSRRYVYTRSPSRGVPPHGVRARRPGFIHQRRHLRPSMSYTVSRTHPSPPVAFPPCPAAQETG